ncbi:MAG: hypothetical protein ACREF9_20155, partial [Opitutaceae bacterium]
MPRGSVPGFLAITPGAANVPQGRCPIRCRRGYRAEMIPGAVGKQGVFTANEDSSMDESLE